MRFLGMKYSLRSLAPAPPVRWFIWAPEVVRPCCSVIGLWSKLLALKSLLTGDSPYCFTAFACLPALPVCTSISSLVLLLFYLKEDDGFPAAARFVAPFLISWMFGLNFLVDLILNEALMSAD